MLIIIFCYKNLESFSQSFFKAKWSYIFKKCIIFFEIKKKSIYLIHLKFAKKFKRGLQMSPFFIFFFKMQCKKNYQIHRWISGALIWCRCSGCLVILITNAFQDKGSVFCLLIVLVFQPKSLPKNIQVILALFSFG